VPGDIYSAAPANASFGYCLRRSSAGPPGTAPGTPPLQAVITPAETHFLALADKNPGIPFCALLTMTFTSLSWTCCGTCLTALPDSLVRAAFPWPCHRATIPQRKPYHTGTRPGGTTVPRASPCAGATLTRDRARGHPHSKQPGEPSPPYPRDLTSIKSACPCLSPTAPATPHCPTTPST
jgi:hypothetical protein